MKGKEGGVIKEKVSRLKRSKEHFSEVLNREMLNNPVDEREGVRHQHIDLDRF